MATVAAIQEAIISRIAKVQEALNEGIDASDLFSETMTRPWTPTGNSFVVSSLSPTDWREPQKVA
jgi:hypothetical protein